MSDPNYNPVGGTSSSGGGDATLAGAQTFTGQKTFSLSPIVPVTNLGTDFASGTALAVNTDSKATLATAKTITFSGTPAAGSTIGLLVNCTTAAVLTIPSCVRSGGLDMAITSIACRVGRSKLLWVYDGATWILFDSVPSEIRHFSSSFDPKAVCDGAVDRLFLKTIGDDTPNGFVITAWRLSCEADPTTELDVDLKRADAFIGVANSAVVDVLDTTAGASSESTPANINGGAAIANGKVLYLEFGTAYTEANHQCVFELWGYPVT